MTLTALLSAFGAWFVGVFTKDVLTFVWGLIQNGIANYQAQQAIAKQAQADASQLQAAKTAQEKENAATAINHDTFGS